MRFYTAPSEKQYTQAERYNINGMSPKKATNNLKRIFYKSIPKHKTIPSLDNYSITWGVGDLY
ncbi:hypothetical protein LFYK43_04740 [Ligilactobacillus salitolerans]|uniref:Uncharacterized protein n=1 Tax=Ligilactobacillus salitolerans TaxID=1808352 RepID=A0A401IR81_9LACO|nr:hypothetical protein LFYK43_04740 [Ligilactobacillus salitolerans]